MWIPTVKALKLNLKHLKMQNLKRKKKCTMGEGISLVRDMFVADTMEEAKKSWRTYG